MRVAATTPSRRHRLPGSYHRGDRVTPVGVRWLDLGAGRYVLRGHDGGSVFAGPDSVEVR